MKQTIILIVLTVITAMGGLAQEADSIKVTSYNNRHTMDGYKALYETGYFWGLDDNNDSESPNIGIAAPAMSACRCLPT